MKILIIDAYDSFVYMLYQYLGSICKGEIMIKRSDQISISKISSFDPDYIVLSPGPGHPKDSGFVPIIKKFKETPMLGVCLGHQAICLVFGGKIKRAKRILHGKVCNIQHDGKTIFEGMKNPFKATRYHSLIATGLLDDLEISARSLLDEYIMGVRHKKYPIEGVQFHPESVMTESGKRILQNFIDFYR